jgi:hypothetical protein
MVEVAAFREEHWDGLLKFWREIRFSFADEPDVFRWKYMQQPAARNGAQLFFVILENGEVAGTMGFNECPIVVGGNVLQSCAFNDWYILPSLRGKGIGKQVVGLFIGRDAPLKLHFVSSEPSLKIVLKHGLVQLAGISEYVEHFAPVRTLVEAAGRKLLHPGRRRVKMKPFLQRFAAIDHDIRLLTASGSELDGFLLRCQMQFPFALARNGEYMRWKYLEHPKDMGALFEIRDGDSLSAIFALAWRCTGARNVLLLSDIYWDRSQPETLARVMRFHRRAALISRANARSIYTGNVQLAKAAQENGMAFSVERLNAFRNDSGVALDPGSVPEWYTCGGDSDYLM